MYICESFNPSDKVVLKRCALKFIEESCEADFSEHPRRVAEGFSNKWLLRKTLLPARFTIVFRGNALRVFSRPRGVREYNSTAVWVYIFISIHIQLSYMHTHISICSRSFSLFRSPTHPSLRCESLSPSPSLGVAAYELRTCFVGRP